MTSTREPMSSPLQPDQLLRELFDTIQVKSPKLAEATLLAAIPFRFDRALLKVLRATDDNLEDKVIERLNQFSFLGESDGHYFITRDMRQYLLTEGQKDRAWFVAAHQRALAYDDSQLTGSANSTPAQREELVQAHLYSLLAVDPDKGIDFLQQLFRQARDEHRPAAAEKYLKIAEEQRFILTRPHTLYFDYLHALLAQFNEQWEVSHQQLTQLLDEHNDDLSPDLRARIQREIGRTFTEQGTHIDAIPWTRQALDSFNQQGNRLESALTTINLGRIYLQVALDIWGGGEPFLVKPPRFRLVFDMLSFITRLPLVIYLITQLGLRSLLPVLHRVGRNMDWLVARLFVTAADYFQQAARNLTTLDDTAGMVQAREDLGRLYLSLNHHRESEKIWRSLLHDFGDQLDPYRKAVAELGLGWVLLRQGKLAEAHTWLEQVEPVFRHYTHHRRMAQTQTLLAQLKVREHKPSEALPHYLTALNEWKVIHHPGDITDIINQIEALREFPSLSITEHWSISAASEFTTERRYNNRYHHPWLSRFSRIALAALVIWVLLTLFVTIRTETGTQVGAVPVLIKPLIPSTMDESSPTVELTISEQLKPTLDVQVATSAAINALIIYLVLYTLIGLYFIWRTPLTTVQETRHADLHVSASGIQAEKGTESTPMLKWADIEIIALVDRFRTRKFTSVFSYTALIGHDEEIIIDGYTNYYINLQHYILKQISPQTPVYRLGFQLPTSLSALIFFASLTLLSLFVGLAQFAQGKTWLTTPWLGNYSLSTLYFLNYLGIALPLVWWFIVQPLRRLMVFEPQSRLVWVVGGIGLFFTGLSFLHQWLSLGRPAIMPSVIAIFLLVSATLHITRARWQRLQQLKPATPAAPEANGYVYQARLRYAVGIITFIFIVLILWQMGRELLSFHHMVLGNSYLQAGESRRNAANKRSDGSAAAPDKKLHELYTQALNQLDQSLALAKYSAVYNSRGAVLDQLGREAEASAAYSDAIRLDPHEPVYRINLALEYTLQASRTITFEQKIAFYQQSIDLYNKLLQAPDSSRQSTALAVLPLQDERQAAEVRLFRASTYYALAQAMTVKLKHDEEALEYAQQAFADYEWLVNSSPLKDKKNQAAYLSGRGWSRFILRTQYTSIDKRRQATIQEAIDEDFTQAVAMDTDNVSAYTGLGWAYWWLMLSVAGCNDAQKRGIDQAVYIQNRQHSVAALTEAIRLQPTSALHYRTRAQLNSLLSDCPGYEKRVVYQSMIDDYNRALTYAPKNAGWQWRRGKIYVDLLAPATDDVNAKRTFYQKAAESFRLAVLLDPTNHLRVSDLESTYHELGMSDKATVDATLTAIGRKPDGFTTYLKAGQDVVAYIKKYGRPAVYPWAIDNLNQALALQPGSYDANWALANAFYDTGKYTDTLDILTRTIQLAANPYEPIKLMGRTNYQLKQYTATIQIADQGLQSQPDDYDLYWLKANAYEKLGDKLQAAQIAQTALALATTPEQAWPLIEFFRTTLGDPAMGNNAIERTVMLAKTVSQLKALSERFRRAGNDTWALQTARKGNKLDATYSDPPDSLGWNAYQSNNFTLAISATLQAIEFQPTEPRLRFNLGVIQLATGNLEAARAAYTKAIEVADDPQNAKNRQARYNEALNDLRSIIRDPQNVYLDFVDMVLQARDAKHDAKP